MSEESMQAMFLRAHVLLHPQRDAIRELLASNVSINQVLSLYPFDLAEWTPELIRHFDSTRVIDLDLPVDPEYPRPQLDMLWRGVIIEDSQLHAQLLGLNSRTWDLPDFYTYLSNETAEFLQSEAGLALQRSMGFKVDASTALTLANDFTTLNELLDTASLWPQKSDRHQYEAEHRKLLTAALHLLLPEEFPMDRPPVRFDTMMFQTKPV